MLPFLAIYSTFMNLKLPSASDLDHYCIEYKLLTFLSKLNLDAIRKKKFVKNWIDLALRKALTAEIYKPIRQDHWYLHETIR